MTVDPSRRAVRDSTPSLMASLQGQAIMEPAYEVWGNDVLRWFPGSLLWTKSLLVDQMIQLAS